MNTLYFLMLTLLSFRFQGCTPQESVPFQDWAVADLTLNDSTFYKIEDKIYGAFIASFSQQKAEAIEQIIEKINQGKSKAPQVAEYWLGYAYYYKSIYYIKYGKKEESEKAIKQGISILDEKKSKNSEDLALLAMLQSFSVQFETGMAAGAVSNRAKGNAAKAIELDGSNLRAYYVSGSLDHYTPKQYGGGKKVEEYLKKAVQLPSQKTKNPYLPSWGKEEAYVLLIQHYLAEEKKDQALAFYKEGIKLFPNSYQMGELAKKLI